MSENVSVAALAVMPLFNIHGIMTINICSCDSNLLHLTALDTFQFECIWIIFFLLYSFRVGIFGLCWTIKQKCRTVRPQNLFLAPAYTGYLNMIPFVQVYMFMHLE